MTREMIEKMVLEKFEARVNGLVEAAMAEHEAEILELLALKPRHAGLLSSVEKDPINGN